MKQWLYSSTSRGRGKKVVKNECLKTQACEGWEERKVRKGSFFCVLTPEREREKVSK